MYISDLGNINISDAAFVYMDEENGKEKADQKKPDSPVHQSAKYLAKFSEAISFLFVK